MPVVSFSPATSSGTSAVYLSGTAGTLGVRVGQIDDIVKVVGNITDATTDSGNPIKVGAKYNSTKPTYTDGQRGDLQIGTRGALAVQVLSSDGITGATVLAPNDDQASQNALVVNASNMLRDRTDGNWDQQSSISASLNTFAADSGIAAVGLVAQFDDTSPTAITEDRFGNVRISSRRELYSQIRDAAGNERGLNVDANNEIGISGVRNSISVHILSTNGTMAVNVGKTDGTVTVRFDPGYTLGKVDQGNATTSGTQAWLVNSQGTASVFTASGSASGVSVSGNTIISPSANASFKVYAFSVQTTAQVSLTCKFTNGAGTGPTEFWRPLITASGVTGVQGSNLSTGGPGNPLFVTGTSTTLSLVLDSASLVHYSVSYTKESA